MNTRWKIIACAGPVIAAASLLICVVLFTRLDKSYDALCTLRMDLERRVTTGEKFLEEHPRGVSGIPKKTIKEDIENQKRTIKALDTLTCSSGK